MRLVETGTQQTVTQIIRGIHIQKVPQALIPKPIFQK